MFGTEFRRRWRSWLILVVLIAVVAGELWLPHRPVPHGNRLSALCRFSRYDVYIYNQKPVPGLSRLPGVSSVTTIGNPATGQPSCACTTQAINPSNFYINELSPDALRRVVKVVAGHLPAESSPYDVLASFTLQQDYGVHIGSVIHAPLYASSEIPALASGANVSPSGPKVALHVVGIGAAEMEFPSGTTPETTSSQRRHSHVLLNKRIVLASVYLVRLRHETSSLAGSLRPPALCTSSMSQIRPPLPRRWPHRSTHRPWAGGCSPSWPDSSDLPSSARRSVGRASSRARSTRRWWPWACPRRHLVVLGMARESDGGSRRRSRCRHRRLCTLPPHTGRRGTPRRALTGLAFDPLVLLLGALATVVVVLILGIWPAVRALCRYASAATGIRRPTLAHRRKGGRHGVPLSAVIGVRHALERGRGAASVPVGTALFGSALAVMALCATVVFADSLTHLTATPALYGSDYQLSFSNSNGGLGNATSRVSGWDQLIPISRRSCWRPAIRRRSTVVVTAIAGRLRSVDHAPVHGDGRPPTR